MDGEYVVPKVLMGGFAALIVCLILVVILSLLVGP